MITPPPISLPLTSISALQYMASVKVMTTQCPADLTANDHLFIDDAGDKIMELAKAVIGANSVNLLYNTLITDYSYLSCSVLGHIKSEKFAITYESIFGKNT